MKALTATTLKAIKACASFSDGDCIFDGGCKVRQGNRCSWFEEAVLPAKPTAQAHYQRYHNISVSKMRHCPDCGDPLQPRERYCDACSVKRKKESARLRMQARRNNG